MTEIDDYKLDERLRAAFETMGTPPADDGFVESVMRRVRRRLLIRRLVLFAAAGAGIAVAVGPLAETASVMGAWLVSNAASWRVLSASYAFWESVGLLALTGAWLGAFRWLAR
jgi:hypothetical protein